MPPGHGTGLGSDPKSSVMPRLSLNWAVKVCSLAVSSTNRLQNGTGMN